MLIDYKKCIQTYGNYFNGIIHIGAHHGEEIKDYASNDVKKILWFEANRKMMKHLFENTSKFSIKQEYFCEVLSDKDGETVQFNITNDSQASSILELGTAKKHYPHIHVIEKKELKTKTFNTIFNENKEKINIEEYDFINLDVQGAELKVLKGFGNLFEINQNIKAIYTEVNFEEIYIGLPLVKEIDDYLNQFGFVRTITSHTPYNWGDALYLRK